MNITTPLFGVGDVIASFNSMGEYLDYPSLIISINTNITYATYNITYASYKCLRISSSDPYYNTISNHSEASLGGFTVIDHKPMAHILYNSNKAPF